MKNNEWLEELVQLYEYRVEDLQAGRLPHGDKHSFFALREALLTNEGLTIPIRRRLTNIDRSFRELQRNSLLHFGVRGSLFSSSPEEAAQASLGLQTPFSESNGSSAIPGRVEIEQGMRHLRNHLWQADSMRWLQACLWAMRSEGRMMSLRLLRSACSNLARAQLGQPPQALLSLSEALSARLHTSAAIEALAAHLQELLSSMVGRARLMSATRTIVELSQNRTQFADSNSKLMWAEEMVMLKRAFIGVEQALAHWPAYAPEGTLPADLQHHPERATQEGVCRLFLDGLQQGSKDHLFTWGAVEVRLQLGQGGAPAQLHIAAHGALARVVLDGAKSETRMWRLRLGETLIYVLTFNGNVLLRQEISSLAELQSHAKRACLMSYLAQAHMGYAPLRLVRALLADLRGKNEKIGNDLIVSFHQAGPALRSGMIAEESLQLLKRTDGISAAELEGHLAMAAHKAGVSPEEAFFLSALLSGNVPNEIFVEERVVKQGGFPERGLFLLSSWTRKHRELKVGEQQIDLLPSRASRNDAGIIVQGQARDAQVLDGAMCLPMSEAQLLLVQHGKTLGVCRTAF